MDFTKLVDWLKLTPRYLIPIALVTGFAIFSSDSVLDTFGVKTFVADNRGYIGVAFLITVALLIPEAGVLLYRRYTGLRVKSTASKKLDRFLRNMTFEEKRILRQYIERQTKTAYFDIENGVVGGLDDDGIIYKATNLRRTNRCAYNIVPDVWDYLQKHPDVLSTSKETTTNKA